MTQDEIVARNVFKVRLFIDAWEATDADVVMACLSDDIVYINQPLTPVVGQHDVRKIVEGIMKLTRRVHWELRNCFGRGNTVVTERLDCWDFDGKAKVRQLIASIFASAKRAEFKILNLFGVGNKVITKRLDQWDWDGSGTWQLQLPVCGMFELTEDGKIYEWREYYDNEHWSKNGGPSLVL